MNFTKYSKNVFALQIFTHGIWFCKVKHSTSSTIHLNKKKYNNNNNESTSYYYSSTLVLNGMSNIFSDVRSKRKYLKHIQSSNRTKKNETNKKSHTFKNESSDEFIPQK